MKQLWVLHNSHALNHIEKNIRYRNMLILQLITLMDSVSMLKKFEIEHSKRLIHWKKRCNNGNFLNESICIKYIIFI